MGSFVLTLDWVAGVVTLLILPLGWIATKRSGASGGRRGLGESSWIWVGAKYLFLSLSIYFAFSTAVCLYNYISLVANQGIGAAFPRRDLSWRAVAVVVCFFEFWFVRDSIEAMNDNDQLRQSRHSIKDRSEAVGSGMGSFGDSADRVDQE